MLELLLFLSVIMLLVAGLFTHIRIMVFILALPLIAFGVLMLWAFTLLGTH